MAEGGGQQQQEGGQEGWSHGGQEGSRHVSSGTGTVSLMPGALYGRTVWEHYGRTSCESLAYRAAESRAEDWVSHFQL